MNTNITQEITCRNIRSLRELNGWTQEVLAGRMGVKAAHVSALERGKRNPGSITMKKLCEVFGEDEQTIRFGKRDESNTSSDELAPLIRLIVEASSLLRESEQAEVLRLTLEIKEGMYREGKTKGGGRHDHQNRNPNTGTTGGN
jgi:transcriptional regulator with XRE-family HTH domain